MTARRAFAPPASRLTAFRGKIAVKASRDEFLAHVLELLEPLGGVAARRMFGGNGLYCDGLFFGIVLDNTLYMKADDRNRGEFERAWSEIFNYSRRGKRATLKFYRAPEDAMDAPHLMLPWARSALSAALRARAGKPPPRRQSGNRKISPAGSR